VREVRKTDGRDGEKREKESLRDGVRGNLVAVGVEILDLTVVGPFVRDVEGGRDGASVRVGPTRFEEILVKLLV